MENVASPVALSQADILSKVETAMGQLENPTAESVKEVLNGIFPPSGEAEALMAFNGYYGLSGSNGFVSIDTTQYFINWPFHRMTIQYDFPIITINVSLDGVSSTQYKFDGNSSFDGTTLKSGDLTLTLTRDYFEGNLVSLSGTVGTASVSGSTYFNPVFLPVFAGNYKEITSRQTILKVEDVAIAFGDGTEMQTIPVFSYNPAMYVINFNLTGKAYTLMLGTAGNQGLACFITSGQSNDFAVTIPQ